MIPVKECCSIFEHFLALRSDKQRRILDAALGEFGRYGYEKTSAEQVAKSAGIGKGMLFRYFGSKLGLYEYLGQYSHDFLMRWFGGLFERMAGLDFIEQYRLMTDIKLRAYQENRGVFEFWTMLYMQPENIAVSPAVKACYEKILAFRGRALGMLQTSDNEACFRRDMEAASIKRYVAWLFDGYSQRLLAALREKPLADLEDGPYWEEFDRILDDLKKLFYEP